MRGLRRRAGRSWTAEKAMAKGRVGGALRGGHAGGGVSSSGGREASTSSQSRWSIIIAPLPTPPEKEIRHP